ncbi:DUF6352 family protein [Methylobacterium oxalidis]|uniref:Uncharacterized protein n=1 Tax=Methylobacterium oxalidis TaxID=944322 RepID=A0A512J7A6_9HYPH|nr:DUF6352 family protein [Methylobacterium oxalidis]GEP05782.1 hypothetical protein MOX02_38200 [Methylobacterium oxalidis]GJE33297.1 hypothetical protein LDDCCGHA_3497 [Methylobacterium oxalidis]GLS62635.1 hypothetical protein GCM10007888_10160 [Methylobacterium oxalidis]
MTEFWVSSGHHLAGRTEAGGLAVTDALLLAYLARPELVPPPEACSAERALHAALLADPRRPVRPAELRALADPDAVENWEVILGFRDRLLKARSIEAAYLDLVRGGTAGTPGLFLNQLVHLILRNALDGCDDPYTLRAAELFFRPQRVSLSGESTLLADAEIIEAREAGASASPLMAMFEAEPASELDVMTDENAWTYWSRSDAFTMALNVSANPRSREGLARAIEAWLRHLLALETRVEPLARIEDRDWRWFVGLDAEATRIGNALWRGEAVDPEAQTRVIALFRMTIPDTARVERTVAGHPIYLLLAMGPDKRVVLKPQNLVAGLPLAGRAA